MSTLGAILIFLLAAAAQFPPQGNSCFPYCIKCSAEVIDGKSKQIVNSVEFRPKTGEEESTNKVLNVPRTNLQVHVSVFFTDESLASNAGADSIELALAIGTRGHNSRKLINRAVGEATLGTLDTLRIMAPFFVAKKEYVAVVECQAPEKVKQK